MLTYPKGTSTAARASGCFCRRLAREGLAQYPKEAQEAKRDFLDFIVRKFSAKFLFVNGLEVINGFSAELLWCCHAVQFTSVPR